MLQSLTCAAFEPHLGETFRLHVDSAALFDVVLVEAAVLPKSAPREGRAPFSIVFRGPPDVVLPQRIYCVEHPSTGAFDLFLVTIGPDGEGMRYEAVFT